MQTGNIQNQTKPYNFYIILIIWIQISWCDMEEPFKIPNFLSENR